MSSEREDREQVKTPVRVERREAVAIVRIERPEARNALNQAVRDSLLEHLELVDRDPEVRCIVLTGTDEVFVAGADVREFADATPVEMLERDQLRWWESLRRVRTPLVAAVRGYALGGGCELALTCDMIVAGEGAEFGQPEIHLGIMPGGGGTQRLARIAGRARAMELLLTGRRFPASEAQQLGLVSRVVPDDEVLDAAVDLATQIARRPPVAVRLIKDAVAAADEMGLEAGLVHERHNFMLLFGTDDKREGIAAFLEKRRPGFRGE